MTRVEIEDVLIGCAWAYDEQDFDALRAAFTDDATFTVSEPGVDTIRGADAIVAFQRAAREGRAGRGERPRHLIDNVRLLEPSDDAARAVSYMTLVTTQADGTAQVALAGTYDDRLVKVDGEWRIAARTLTFDRHRTA